MKNKEFNTVFANNYSERVRDSQEDGYAKEVGYTIQKMKDFDENTSN